MNDDISKSDFENFLIRKGFTFEIRQIPGNLMVYIINDYIVPNGLNQGKHISIGFPIPPDYPSTAPYGIHVNATGLEGNLTNINPSPLGGNWKFWSKRMGNWVPGRRNSQYYFDFANRLLEGV
jgi:hypothetical protein